MNKFFIYHNPRCSKSRETLEILKNAGVEPEVIEYLKTPPTETELRELIRALKLKPSQVVRQKEPVFEELALDLMDDDAVIQALLLHPILLERPIVFSEGRAVLGRPPEKVREAFFKN